MDWLEFISHSEWHLVVAGTVFILRNQLRTLFDRVSPTKLDAWGFKAEFERKLEKIEALASADPATPEPREIPTRIDHAGAKDSVGAESDVSRDGPIEWELPSLYAQAAKSIEWGATREAQRHLRRYRDTSPETALIKGWERFERGVRNVVTWAGIDIKNNRVSAPLLQQIGLSDDQVKIFRELRSLRNRVAHADGATPLTREETARFLDAVEPLWRAVQTAMEDRAGRRLGS